MAAVSVIVPARNAAATLPRLLDALAAQDLDEPFETIVVDDGSNDETVAVARRHPTVTSTLRAAGAGPGAARNRGAAQAAGGLLAFTDADCVPEPGWLRAGLAAAREADIVQGAVALPEGAAPGPFDRVVVVGRFSHLYETANLLVQRELFERLGGFEPWLAPRGGGKELGEDVWLGWRARRAGARAAFAPDALVRHPPEPRDALEFIAEHARLRFFPAIAERIPEMREDFFYRRLFLNRRTALFDLAVAGVGAAALTRRALPLAAVIPYVHAAAGEARRWGCSRAPELLAVRAAADALGLAAMASGSVRARSLLL
jgi:glycosyltransferase involved in cell wall biosynthesis